VGQLAPEGVFEVSLKNMTNVTLLPKRIARTAKAIEAAGLKLFAAYPVDAVAIDDIVKEADVAKGTFYNHFADKSALLNSIVAHIRAGLEARIQTANADIHDPAVRIARAIGVYTRYALDEPACTCVLTRVEINSVEIENALNQGLVQDVSKGIAEGRFAISDMEAGILMVAGVTRIIMSRISGEPSINLAINLTQHMSAMLLHGFGVEQREAEAIARASSDQIVRQ
jgi:AcrR family transcriptional regulator